VEQGLKEAKYEYEHYSQKKSDTNAIFHTKIRSVTLRSVVTC